MNRSMYLVALVLAAGLSACSQPGDAKQKETAKSTIGGIERDIVTPVEAEWPKRGTIAAYFETTSRIMAENRVEITTKISGTCIEIRAEEGDLVREGQLLAVLDQPEAHQALAAAEIQVPHRKVEFERATKELSFGLTSQAAADAARASYEQALANVRQQRVQVDNLTVRAPITGVITARNVQMGQVVPMGQPIFSMVDPESYILRITPPEQELPRLRRGQLAHVNIDALGGRLYEATVRRINPAVDAMSGTIEVVLDFDKAIQEQLMDAAFARVRLVMETREDVLLVPKDAIIEENARKYVFVVHEQEEQDADAGPVAASTVAETAAMDALEGAPQRVTAVAERVEVRVGLEDREHVEILSGLDDAALVITLGQHNLKAGSRITVTNIEDALLANAGLDADAALAVARQKRESAEDRQQGPQRMRRQRMH
jgi:membrane fusion protein, multidrug efflux system